MNVRIASATTIRSGVITSRTDACSRSRRMSCSSHERRDEPVDLREHVLVGQPQIQERARERPRRREQLRLAPGELAEPPARRLGERQQPQRLAGRRAVDHDHVPAPLLDVVADPQQAEQLVPAGRDRQLLGRDPLDPALDQHRPEPRLHGGPVALQLVLRGHLLRPQLLRDLAGLGADGLLEDVAQRAGRVGRQQDRPLPRGGAAARGGGSDGRLADAALARVEDGARGQGP